MSRRTALRFHLLALFPALLLVASTLAAQTPTGTISGRVVDADQLAIPGVVVTVTSPNLQGVRMATTSSNGAFILPSLPPGEYTVEVRNPAFPRSVTLQASVATGKVETRVAEFRRVDAAAYFRRVGLQP